MSTTISTATSTDIAVEIAVDLTHSKHDPNTLGRSAYSQEHSATIVYAKFGRQTECIMGNWKIENVHKNLWYYVQFRVFHKFMPFSEKTVSLTFTFCKPYFWSTVYKTT